MNGSTGWLPDSPLANARIVMSRSVMVPIARPASSQTGKKPIPSSRIRTAASSSVVRGEMHFTSLFIRSWHTMLRFLRVGFVGQKRGTWHGRGSYGTHIAARPLLGPSFAHSHAAQRRGGVRTVAKLRDVREADDAFELSVLAHADYPRDLHFAHQILRGAEVLVTQACHRTGGHESLDGLICGMIIGDDADRNVPIRERADHVASQVTHRQKPNLLIPHERSGSRYRRLRRNKPHVA